MADSKDTIYIDIDDEITSIIDKMRSSDKKIVALVLPKRATVLQSIVNMKLLKKTAEKADKNVVLITSEEGLLPLAGAVGVHVASTLQSKPEIPPPPDTLPVGEKPIHEEVPEDPNHKVGKAEAAAAVAGAAALKAQAKDHPKEETVELDDSEKSAGKKPASKSKDKKTKVPNFDKFRKRLVIGALAAVAFIVLWILAFGTLQKATIIIKTDTTNQDINPDITVDTDAKSVSVGSGIVPGHVKEIKHSDSQSAPATGEKNKGSKATGQLTATNCNSLSHPTVLAGSKFTSDGGKVFTNNSSFTPSTALVNGSICYTATFGVTAVEGGASYNLPSSTSYTSSSLKDYDISGKTSGGTDQIVKVVSQADIDSAKQKTTSDKDEAKADLKKALEEDGLYAITDSFNGGKATVSSSPQVGQEADSVNVTSTITYTMLGVKEESLEKIIDNSVKGEIDTKTQSVQDYGLDNANFTVNDKNGNQTRMSMQTTIAIGPKLNVDEVKQQVAGKEKGTIQDEIGNVEGVKEVIVDFSPFWVHKAPKNPAKINVVIESANESGTP